MAAFKGKSYFSHDDRSRKIGDIPCLSPNFIQRPVGLGGLNRAGDVYKVQRLINIVGTPGIIGGSLVPLKPDGEYGKKTRDRIVLFQQARFDASDGLVEVDGPTMRSLLIQSYSVSQNAALPKLPNSVFRNSIPDGSFINEEKDINGHIIPRMNDTERVARCVSALPEMLRLANAAIITLSNAIDNKDGLHESLFLKHFRRIDETYPANYLEKSRALDLLKMVRHEITRRLSITNGDFRGLSIGSFYNGTTVDMAFAIAWMGGKKSNSIFPKLFDDSYQREIWAGPRLDYIGLWYFSKVLFHELCHYCGKERESGHAIVDNGYQQMEEHNEYLNKDMFYSKMTASQRRENADTYAAFALEALHGTDVLKGWRNNPAGEFDRPPFVDFKGVLFGGEIRPTKN